MWCVRVATSIFLPNAEGTMLKDAKAVVRGRNHAFTQRLQLTRDRVQLRNRLEALLEEPQLTLSSLVPDLLGTGVKRFVSDERVSSSGDAVDL
jgi:hypothetical protein